MFGARLADLKFGRYTRPKTHPSQKALRVGTQEKRNPRRWHEASATCGEKSRSFAAVGMTNFLGLVGNPKTLA